MFYLLLSSFFSLEFQFSRLRAIAKEVWSQTFDQKKKTRPERRILPHQSTPKNTAVYIYTYICLQVLFDFSIYMHMYVYPRDWLVEINVF